MNDEPNVDDQRADTVDLRIPAETRHVATARVVAASLAADLGFDIDEIDDLRLGVNEAVAVLLDAEAGVAGDDLDISFRVTGRQLDIEVSRRGITSPVVLDELADRILGAVVDHHAHHDGVVRLSKSSRDVS